MRSVVALRIPGLRLVHRIVVRVVPRRLVVLRELAEVHQGEAVVVYSQQGSPMPQGALAADRLPWAVVVHWASGVLLRASEEDPWA